MNGYEPLEVVKAVKRALWDVSNQRTPITQVDLTLKTLQEQGAGFSLKVPWLSDIEVSAGAKESMTQTINLSLTLPDELLDAASTELQQAVVAMVGTFNAMLDVATDGEHGKPLLFRDGTAAVEFVFDQQGQIKLIFNAGLRANYANTVKVKFGART
ncbi:hypothetical protein DEDE109153_09105 [Deinococcus deserti]|uniref:Uncharacterized protein n=1 Tax=Deinococcus deserti (strain DSM 17065 / CIP 109153 / LMG 22923 / VCD115) TaxID=546414 RepID=C1D452_DEIDV|nr:hypothetical protein [Deinococcus deserti]ACO47933.2 Hypothetical protein Deide_3p00250 [Deinococcus deserti VCD115]